MRLAIAPVVWLVHFVVVYALATVACEVLETAVVAATAPALAAYAALAVLDGRRWARLREGPAAFISGTNVLLCMLSAIATLWVAYPAFVLPPCADSHIGMKTAVRP